LLDFTDDYNFEMDKTEPMTINSKLTKIHQDSPK